jgi:hypothetical protein
MSDLRDMLIKTQDFDGERERERERERNGEENRKVES